MSEPKENTDTGVVDLERARERLRSRPGKASAESLNTDLEKIRTLLDQGMTGEARSQLNSILAGAR
ncbi:MAG: hypothetical protein ACXW3C_15515, partial [Pyrinomonadaceae bacterium]